MSTANTTNGTLFSVPYGKKRHLPAVDDDLPERPFIQVDRGLYSAKINQLRASPSGKASAFQADIRRFESGHPL